MNGWTTSDGLMYPVKHSEDRRLLRLREVGWVVDLQDPALDQLCKDACTHFKVASAAVTILTEERQYLVARAGIEAESTQRCIAFSNYTILNDKIFVVPDTWQSDIFRTNPLVTGAPFARFYAGAPLCYSNELTLGTLCLLDPAPRVFTLGDRAELLDFRDQGIDLIHRWIIDNG